MKIGIDRLMEELETLNYSVSKAKDSNGLDYAVISNFNIPAGSFAGRVIDLAIPAPADFPRSVGASMHLKSNPHLVEFKNIPQVRNVIQSPLGNAWQYWSYAFKVRPNNSTNELITQINEIFRKN